eukprot:scaffold3238_cov240-Pinguiococcus_pyrenoidosus.AAC.2
MRGAAYVHLLFGCRERFLQERRAFLGGDKLLQFARDARRPSAIVGDPLLVLQIGGWRKEVGKRGDKSRHCQHASSSLSCTWPLAPYVPSPSSGDPLRRRSPSSPAPARDPPPSIRWPQAPHGSR